MENILVFRMKDISFANCGEVLIWIGTGALIIAGVLELINKPKK